MPDCTCPQCTLSRHEDRKTLRAVYVLALIVGCAIAVVRWAW